MFKKEKNLHTNSFHEVNLAMLFLPLVKQEKNSKLILKLLAEKIQLKLIFMPQCSFVLQIVDFLVEMPVE